MADNENIGTSTVTDSETQLNELGGAFVASLRRNNKAIRSDRALTIAEDAEMAYKRELEDSVARIKRLKRDQANMLDLSPNDTVSLKVASDFDGKIFVTKDIEISVSIKQEELRLEEAIKRYNLLFGKEFKQ
jgi:hypothetical protein